MTFVCVGDVVQYEENNYKILGRSSVDIIKSGGYKISALFVESVLLQNPNIKDVTVVGLPDATWGQKVSYSHKSKDKTLPQFNYVFIFISRLLLFMCPLTTKPIPLYLSRTGLKINYLLIRYHLYGKMCHRFHVI